MIILFPNWLRYTGAVAVLVCTLVGPQPSHAEPYRLTEGSDLIGKSRFYETVPGDTLIKIAALNKLGFAGLMAANPGIDPWLPGTDEKLTLPGAHLLPAGTRTGIVINLPEQRLYHFLPEGQVQSFAVMAEMPGCALEPGRTVIKRRRRQPSWKPSAEVKTQRPDLPAIVPPGPRNPLGKYALDLKLAGRIIHGSVHPFSNRGAKRYGCIELYIDDMTLLYRASLTGTPVTVVDQPIKLGWSGGELYMEAHPTREQVADLSGLQRMRHAPSPGFPAQLEHAAKSDLDRVDQVLVRSLLRERTGIPTKITHARPPPKIKKVRGLFGEKDAAGGD